MDSLLRAAEPKVAMGLSCRCVLTLVRFWAEHTGAQGTPSDQAEATNFSFKVPTLDYLHAASSFVLKREWNIRYF